MCNKGLSCPICFKVLDRVTKKELQVYAEEKFKIENHPIVAGCSDPGAGGYCPGYC